MPMGMKWNGNEDGCIFETWREDMLQLQLLRNMIKYTVLQEHRVIYLAEWDCGMLLKKRGYTKFVKGKKGLTVGQRKKGTLCRKKNVC